MVPMCSVLRACTVVPENAAEGMTPPRNENASAQATRAGSGSAEEGRPIDVTPIASAPPPITVARDQPRLMRKPPSWLPGMLIATNAAVSSAAVPALAPRSSTANVGSQVMIELHWPT
jgi:hypothetical protein